MRKCQLMPGKVPRETGADCPQFQAFSLWPAWLTSCCAAYQTPRLRPFQTQVQIGG